MTYTLDRELALTGDGATLTSPGSELYWNGQSAFGGWVMALMARAVMLQEGFRGAVLTTESRFMAPVKVAPLRLSVSLMQRRRRFDFWRVTLEQDGNVAATTDIVAGETAPSDLDFQIDPPAAKPREESLPILPAPPLTPVWLKAFDQFLAKGVPFRVNENTESLLWIRENDGRPIDTLSLILMADAPMPRSFFMADGLRPGSSISISTYVYATREELAALGNTFLLMRVGGAFVGNGLLDQRVEMWSEAGKLIGVSNQIGVHR